MAGGKKSSLKPIHIPADSISLTLLSHILAISNLTFLEKGELCVAKRTSPTRLYTSVYTNPPNALLPTCTRPTTLTSTPCFDFTYHPIGLITIEALYTYRHIIHLSATIC